MLRVISFARWSSELRLLCAVFAAGCSRVNVIRNGAVLTVVVSVPCQHPPRHLSSRSPVSVGLTYQLHEQRRPCQGESTGRAAQS